SRVARFDVAELGLSDAKSLGNLSQKLHFVWMEHPVRLGDVEQAFQHVLEQLAVALEDGGELVGKGLVSSDVPFGEIKDVGDVRHLSGRYLEHLLEGIDLIVGDDTVSLGHLSA